MKIHSVKITNFKSCYGTQEFIFDELEGLVKLSGPIGSGKTLLCEAIQWGLLGTVKGQTNPSLIAWNTDACEVEINLTSIFSLLTAFIIAIASSIPGSQSIIT